MVQRRRLPLEHAVRMFLLPFAAPAGHRRLELLPGHGVSLDHYNSEEGGKRAFLMEPYHGHWADSCLPLDSVNLLACLKTARTEDLAVHPIGQLDSTSAVS